MSTSVNGNEERGLSGALVRFYRKNANYINMIWREGRPSNYCSTTFVPVSYAVRYVQKSPFTALLHRSRLSSPAVVRYYFVDLRRQNAGR
jgi:hypothetical protein